MGARDEADQLKDGDLPADPASGTHPVGKAVPRVLTVVELLQGSAVRAMSKADADDVHLTGHYKLDNITGGMRAGYSWLFGADTSYGKSSWLISVADENIRRGKTVLIVSSEDTEEVYADRLMVRRAKVNATRYRDKKLLPEELSRVQAVADRAEPVPVFIDARRWNVEELAPHLIAIIREHKVDVVAFDYIQEFRSKKRHQDERVKFREIASVLRHTAKSEKIASVLFSQLTVDGSTGVPTRHNIRECRDIANASEVILIGYEQKEDLKDEFGGVIVKKGDKCLFVDKVKNGPRGAKLRMEWNSESACFDVVADPETEAIAQAIGDVGKNEYWDKF